jgi:hypothetical protein
MSSSCRNVGLSLGAGALIALAASGARAANWEWLPRVETGATYSDNYRLADTSVGRITNYGPYIDAELAADLVSPTTKIEFIPHIISTFYPSDHADQSTNGYFDFDGSYTTLRSNFTWLAYYSNETVIYSELLPATFPGVPLGSLVGGVSGRVSVPNRRQLERLAPAYTYDITQRTHLHLGGDAERTTFKQSEFEQVGYTNYSGDVGLSYDLSPRSAIALTGTAARFMPQLGGHDTNRYDADLEWRMHPSQIMQFYARVGASQSQAQSIVGTVSSTGITGGMGVDLRYQVTEVTLDAVRAVRPSEVGAEVAYNELRARVLHAFAPLFSGFFGVRALRLRSATSAAALQVVGEDYYTAEAGCDYQITESFRIEAKDDYYWQRFQGSQSANSNTIGVSFIYQPLSRYEPLPEFTGIPEER